MKATGIDKYRKSRVTVYLDKKLHARLKKLAQKQGLKFHIALDRAVLQYLPASDIERKSIAQATAN